MYLSVIASGRLLGVISGQPSIIESSAGSSSGIYNNIPARDLATLSLDAGGSGTWSLVLPGPLTGVVTLSATTGASVTMKANANLGATRNGTHTILVRYAGESVALEFPFTLTVTTPSTQAWPGYNSGLDWISGAFQGLDQTMAMRTLSTTKKRPLDLCLSFNINSGKWDTASQIRDQWISSHGNPWEYMKSHGIKFFGVGWRVFTTGTNWNGRTVAAWPTKGNISPNSYISPAFPPGYPHASLTAEQKRLKGLDVWQHAADGHFDHLWDSQLRGIRTLCEADAYYKVGFHIILRPFWEGNGAWAYGAGHTIDNRYAGGMARTQAEATICRDAFKRFISVARNAWGNYLFHFNPLRTSAGLGLHHFVGPGDGTIESGVWDFIGPDYYDAGLQVGAAWPTGTNEQRWNLQVAKTRASDVDGLASWGNLIRANINTGVKLGFGEWNCMKLPHWQANAGGDDNPVYINRMFEFFTANKDIMGYESLYNKGASEHLIGVAGSGSAMLNAGAAYKAKWTAGL